MFGIIGKAFALLIFGSSGLANLYKAGKYASGYEDVSKGNKAKNIAITAFVIDVVAFILLAL